MNKNRVPLALIAAAASVLATGIFVNKVAANDGQDRDGRFKFQPDSLVLSRSVYVGTASTVTIGETLPLGCAGGPNGSTVVNVPTTTPGTTTPVTVTCGIASDNGEFPNLFDSHNVWNNSGSDGSFGVTSPIFLDNITTEGLLLGSLPIPSDKIVTSFSSKSELALNRSIDGNSITFMAYHGGPGCGGFPVSPTAPNLLDVSASNTPGVCDPTNAVITTYHSDSIVPTAYYRAVVEVDGEGHIDFTPGNAYSGDNGRAAIKGAKPKIKITTVASFTSATESGKRAKVMASTTIFNVGELNIAASTDSVLMPEAYKPRPIGATQLAQTASGIPVSVPISAFRWRERVRRRGSSARKVSAAGPKKNAKVMPMRLAFSQLTEVRQTRWPRGIARSTW